MAAHAAIVSLVQTLHPDEFPLLLQNPEIDSLYRKLLSLQSILEEIFPITRNIRQHVNDLDGRIREAIYRAQDEIEYLIIKQYTLSSENFWTEIIAEIDNLAAEAEEIERSINKKMVSSPVVDSLVKVLQAEGHLNSHSYPLYEKLVSLQSCFKKICDAPISITVAVRELDIQIREAASKAEYIINSLILSQSDSSESEIESFTPAFLQDLQEITASIDPLAEEAEEMARSIEEESQAQDLLSENARTFEHDSRMKKRRIVGQKEEFEKLKNEILGEKNNSQREVLPISGLPGSGKTTLARSIYEDWSITDEFEICGWVTVSEDSQVGDIISKLFHSLETKSQKAGGRDPQLGRNEKLQDAVYRSLHRKKYLIVVDGMWNKHVWDEIRLSLPDDWNESRIVLTTRDKNIVQYAKSSDFHLVMRPLSEEDSWVLLCLTVFGEGGSCPPHLKDIGLEIAKNCNGLPLSLMAIGGLLSQENMTKEYWESIQADTLHAAGKGDEAYLEILYLSYNNLPGRLKGCFLYMGAFPEDSEIPVTKLIRLWVAEGFLKPSSWHQTVEHVAYDYLEQLIDRNLLVICKFTSNGQTKTCAMHNSLRDISAKECGKEKFFHSRRKYLQELPEGTNNQRRISVHRNVLMCLEEVHSSVKQITSARTLLFAGPHHHHPLPSCLTFDLLRVLDAFTLYFIGFPIEILGMIHLRYLSLTYNGKLPSKLSNLQKLQILIVRRHPKIPVLKNTILFANLQALSNVSAASCTKEVLENMPNLTKLAMWTNSPVPVGLYLDQVEKLESFKFSVLNPIPKKKVEFLPRLYFPGSLKKLRLRGCSLPWEAMTVIGQLPFLEVLKLREIAFEGEEWCPGKREFRRLKFLLLEYLDLVWWEADHTHFPKLERLILRHCYELGEIPEDFEFLGNLELIELVDCSPDAVESAEQMKEKVKKRGFSTKLKIQIYSSWK